MSRKYRCIVDVHVELQQACKKSATDVYDLTQVFTVGGKSFAVITDNTEFKSQVIPIELFLTAFKEANDEEKSGEKITEELKYVWAYLLIHGCVANSDEWDFYGGFDTWKCPVSIASIREKALTVGINWNKTDVPLSQDVSRFNGTFESASELEVTVGTLYLTDGSKYIVTSDENEAVTLVNLARQSMKQELSKVDLLAEKI